MLDVLLFVAVVGVLLLFLLIVHSPSPGCEFCDNGDWMSLKDKYDNPVEVRYCPKCGRPL